VTLTGRGATGKTRLARRRGGAAAGGIRKRRICRPCTRPKNFASRPDGTSKELRVGAAPVRSRAAPQGPPPMAPGKGRKRERRRTRKAMGRALVRAALGDAATPSA
jgi:hypothetical protein